MNNQWWLRTQDEVFGPVTRDNLIEWARMGRIQPGQDVSCDGENWMPATDVDFLDMRWSIDIGDGMPPRGPFNKQAAQALLASGRLPQGSTLVEAVQQHTSVKEDGEDGGENSVTIKEEQSVPVDNESVPAAGSSDDQKIISELKLQLETLQANEEVYEGRIKLLSDEIKRLPPTAQLAADAQAAMYTLMREEADELSLALEAEQKEVELLREYRRARTERLLARRQEILRRIGTDADDMMRRAIRAHPEDPRTAHMRQELDALRILQERTTKEAERKINDLSLKLRDSMTEAKRLREQAADVTVIYRQLQETREKLQMREKELVEERQRSEIERQQHAAAQQALLARLSSLETGLPGGTNQSREARTVRLAPWMGLKT